MELLERLERWRIEARPIGFSPWRDADGMRWGIVTKFDKSTFTVDEISPLGQPDGQGQFRFSSVSYFDESRVYSQRLSRLREFVPTRPEDRSFVRDRKVVRSILQEASESGEVLRLRLRSEEEWSNTARVLSYTKEWVELRTFDDLMVEDQHMIWRVSTVEAVQWRTAHEEADAYLEAQVESGRKA
jgi:hypothetical protein